MRRGAEWYLQTPPAIVPVPAASHPDLCGERVIISVPPGGFRYDMRAVTYPYVHTDGLVRVDVLAEHDWYRAYVRKEAVPTTRFPIDDVWVEHRVEPADQPEQDDGPEPGPGPDGPAGHEEHAAGRYAFLDRLVTLGGPPVRKPRRARDADQLTGRRVVVVQPDGPLYERRAVSEPYLNAEGDVMVNVCPEYDWYRWAIVRDPPGVDPVEIYLLWVE